MNAMDGKQYIIWIPGVILVSWTLLALWINPWLRCCPRRDFLTGIGWRLARLFVRIIHRPTWDGTGCLPRSDLDHEGLIVVCNHTGAIDPVLVQARCPFWITWMANRHALSHPSLRRFRNFLGLLSVNRDGQDAGPLRSAIRHVKDGGAIGIMPEGRITIPPREIRPFLPGVGLITSRTGAPVLLVWIRGTPDTNRIMPSLFRPSRAKVDFLGIYRFEKGESPRKIARILREKITDASGWPLNESVLPPG